ncbi:MAG: DUF4954 family protein [Planctomycetes bacterium]|nr:DUF4954 family protein [Planctomycetota bacterium]
MNDTDVLPAGSLGREFISDPYVPEGCDEYYLRNQQSPRDPAEWRNLRADEIETLVKNGNRCDNWDDILVTDQFDATHIRNCEFHGLVRIGRLEAVYLKHHDLTVPVGLTNSRIISCDIGDNAAIHNVDYLAYYIIGDRVILANVDEMCCTNHAKFGNGIVKEGETEDVRIWLDLVNEAGGRSVLPFDGMIAADAALWCRYRDDPDLMVRLGEITQRTFDPRRGFYGTVGDECVVKNSRVIKDVKIGPCAYIKGANKLKNLTINSSDEEPSQIGEGVELVNGIIGRGCHIFYGCKAVRFVLGENSNLKYGARLVHSYLGANSTVSCCEILNNLIFPAHEQHHNNSFLVASLVMGQSNLAACATIGSNHNSRAPDGEIHAGRGFWPGLCVSLKHNSRFASFCLIAKGDYPAELNVPLPFCLVSQDDGAGRLHLMPAYWWLYNMYALARNTWKFGARDKRKVKVQNIEFDSLAPDTAEEMFAARALLERWAAKAAVAAKGQTADNVPDRDLAARGRDLLNGAPDALAGLDVRAEDVENSRRSVGVLKAREGYHAYGQMLLYYAVKNLLDWMEARPDANFAAMAAALDGPREQRWVNLGGQLIPGPQVDTLRDRIRRGDLDSWDAIHEAYNALWAEYPEKKQQHAFATLGDLLGAEALTDEAWQKALDDAVAVQEYISDQVYASRKKDFTNPFRRMVYETEAEMQAVLGTVEDNSFVHQTHKATEAFKARVAAVRERG